MSLAKVNQIGRVRKPGKCGKCGQEVNVGDPAVRFSVGFRGFVQTRCTKTECYPKPSERESSLVSGVYAAQEDADVSAAGGLEDLTQIRDDVVTATQEVAGEYEDSEMFERNMDLQERAEMLNSAAEALEQWEPEDEPEEDAGEWTIDGVDYTDFEEAQAAWLEAARESLQTAIDEMELP
jgi:hypothetical protein